MSSSFFLGRSKGGVKRKIKNNIGNVKKVKRKVSSKDSLNDEISSNEESDKHYSEEESDENLTTAQEIKVALAKKYLDEIEKEEKERLETDDVQNVVVSRLREDLLEQAGSFSKKIADSFSKPDENNIQVLHCRQHQLSITCIVVSKDGKYIYSASKDATIVKWDIVCKRKVGHILSKHKEKNGERKENAHNSAILSLSISFDNKYLASGDKSSIIRIWDTNLLEHLHSFKGHRGSVTGLAFCCDSNNLYSCSSDRSIRIWNLDEMSFVETLFGHQCSVTDIDVLRKDRAVTSGGVDNTLRVWKVQEESQLIFNGHLRSIDRVRRIDQQHFVSCGDDGHICIWGMLKKKPLTVVPKAHGSDVSNMEPNWITSVSCLPNSDLIVSGSNDGHLRFWKCEENFRNLLPLFTIPVQGFINSVSFSHDGRYLIVGVGQEHRLGRWFVNKNAKNCILLILLNNS